MSPMQNHQLQFQIEQVVSDDDIKQLAHIHVEALKDDASAAVKFSSRDEFLRTIATMLESQVPSEDDPGSSLRSNRTRLDASHVNDWFIVKATWDSSDKGKEPGLIVGWASWLHENPNAQEKTGDQASVDPVENTREDERKLLQFHHGLGAFSRQRQSRVYADWYSRRPRVEGHSSAPGFLSLRACFVLPEYQRRGIGSALVRYGCERADRLILDSLVTSTPSARQLYATAGDFEILDNLDVDLRDWVVRKEDGMKHFGSSGADPANSMYRFCFMARVWHGCLICGEGEYFATGNLSLFKMKALESTGNS